MFMDDNARPHRARIVQKILQQEAVQAIPWPAMSPDMNPIEHVWDFIGRKINQRNPKCQNIEEKQPQTVTPPPPKAVVPKMWLS
jgi:transposase